MSAPKGFTLVEALVYIALLGILLVGVIVSAYPLLTGAERITAKVAAEQEAVFILRKITADLNSASSISSPAIGTPGTTLTLTKVGGTTVSYSFSGTAISETVGGVTLPLNAGRVAIKNFAVLYMSPAGSQKYIQIEFDAGDDHIGPLRKYLPF